MRAFNKEVANKLYTALTAMTSGAQMDRDAAFLLFASHRPPNWDAPKIDRGLKRALQRIAQ